MKLGFGELELAVLNLLKKIQPASVRELTQKLPQQYAYTTIMTVCKRLEEKGVLKRTKVGRHFTYRLSSSKPSQPKSLFTRLKNHIFAGRTLDMVSYLIEQADDVTNQDLDEIEKLLNKKRKR